MKKVNNEDSRVTFVVEEAATINNDYRAIWSLS